MDDIKTSLEFCNTIFSATEDALQSWDFSQNLEFPELLTMAHVRLSHLTPDDLKEADPIIRFHVRRHTKYCVSRGAKGGIMLRSIKVAKEAAKAAKEATKLAKEAAKEEIKAQLEAKVAASNPAEISAAE
jgi:hypothetical protein